MNYRIAYTEREACEEGNSIKEQNGTVVSICFNSRQSTYIIFWEPNRSDIKITKIEKEKS